jgi:hypothetical protein
MCGTETLMLMPEHAAIVCGTTQREMFRQIENGELHFIETTKGELFVCSNSLQQQSRNIDREQIANGKK